MSYSEKLAYAIAGILALIAIDLTVLAFILKLYAIDSRTLFYAIGIVLLEWVYGKTFCRIRKMLRSD